ncbi:hypothetical protein JTB14_029892 [Gonioctena quinquepunctata]|nr:hypothetical protein JTB14_029892 [Gonioctena quinquepunctata]
MEQKLGVDDFVWAKLTGYPPWPSMIVEPELEVPEKPLNDSKREYFWVYFFGSHDYSWIEERHIKPYEQYRDKYVPLYKKSLFVGAVEELEEHLERIKNNPNYKVNTKEKFRPKSRGVKRNARAQSSTKKRPKSKSVEIGDDTMTDMNLIISGHTVNIWNRSTRKSDELLAELGNSGNIRGHLSPRAVLVNSEIVFICVADHQVAKQLIINNFGVNNSSDNILKDKGLVVMTSIDPGTSNDIRNMVEKKEGNYLEAQIQGSRIEERFCVLTAGCGKLFHACQSCFYAMGGKNTFFLGEVGNAAKFNMVLQLMKGIYLVALSEGLALAERCSLPQGKLIDVFSITGLSSPYLKGKANLIVEKNFNNEDLSLKNMQKDIRLGLELSNELEQPMLLSSMANQIFKHCRKLDYGNHDAAAIHLRNKY